MKNYLFSLLSVGVACFLLLPEKAVAAPAEYFVEVGDDVRKEDAAEEWAELSSKYKSLLGKLKLYPKDVLQQGQMVTTRMQAGPITSKAAAMKICNKLFAADVPCFVIEGVNDMPPTAVMRLKGEGMPASGNLPWLSASGGEVRELPVKGEDTAVDGSERAPRSAATAPVTPLLAEPAKPSKPVELPWLKEKKAAPQIAEPQAPREAKVQVAEAIRVPLTETVTLEDEIRVRSLPELQPSFGIRQLRDESGETGSVNSGAGWLDVGHFVNEEIATSLWDEVRGSNRKQAKNLNMRVARPAVEGGKVTLSVGPFANSAEAYNFCRSGLQANDRGLNCSFVANDPGLANGKLLALNAHADAYAERAERQRRRPVQNPDTQMASAESAAKLSPAAGPAKQYWVQVVSADSQMQALKQWEQVKAANAGVIGNLRSSVSASATDRSSYVVRVGPIPENDEAIRVCSQLQKRNVDCRVLLYSRGNI